MLVDDFFDLLRIPKAIHGNFNVSLTGRGDGNCSNTKYSLEETLIDLHVSDVTEKNFIDMLR